MYDQYSDKDEWISIVKLISSTPFLSFGQRGGFTTVILNYKLFVDECQALNVPHTECPKFERFINRSYAERLIDKKLKHDENKGENDPNLFGKYEVELVDFFKYFYFMTMRLVNTYRMEDGVICVPGMETGFTACSPGELLRGVDVGIHETTVDWCGDQGIHMADYRRVRRLHNLKYAGVLGGCNTSIIEHKVQHHVGGDGQSSHLLYNNVGRFKEDNFVVRNEESASMMLMLLPADQNLRSKPFLWSAGFSPLNLDRTPGTDDYPDSAFWTRYFGISGSINAFQEVNTRPYTHMVTPALAMFRSKMMYPRQNGGLEIIPGETHHGYEGPGARLVRTRGETCYPVQMAH